MLCASSSSHWKDNIEICKEIMPRYHVGACKQPLLYMVHCPKRSGLDEVCVVGELEFLDLWLNWRSVFYTDLLSSSELENNLSAPPICVDIENISAQQRPEEGLGVVARKEDSSEENALIKSEQASGEKRLGYTCRGKQQNQICTPMLRGNEQKLNDEVLKRRCSLLMNLGGKKQYFRGWGLGM